MRSLIFTLTILAFQLMLPGQLISQEADLGEPIERLFIESKWRYTYTLHAESNTIIHKAEDKYDFYLYFRYDYTYQEFLNDRLSEGNWSLNGRSLFYSFQHVSKFEIVELNKSVLVLEFTQRNAKGAYQYHFVRVDSKDSPFPKPDNELPEVIVEVDNPNVTKYGQKKKRTGLMARLFGKKKKSDDYDAKKEALTHINIELIGGGYYGGIDPVLKDFIQIRSDGRLVQEFQSVNTPLHVTKKDIPREELEMFADWVVKQGFFNMERSYDCTDAACQQRKRQKPAPIPLRLAIAYGDQKKVVTIAIWGQDDLKMKYVDYPPALDGIIDAIQRMANRLDDPMVRK